MTFKLLTDAQLTKLYPHFNFWGSSENKLKPYQAPTNFKDKTEEKEMLKTFERYEDKLIRLRNEAYSAMYEILNRFQIDSKLRQAFFFAQCAHETQGFFRYDENLRYSTTSLMTTFKGKFTFEEAKAYAMKPEKIANKVYANRFGNGDEASGDGWLYHGRGMLQTTFKANYEVLKGENLSFNYAENPELVSSTFIGAVESAAHFWRRNGLNASADAQRLDTNTRIINGGMTNYSDRQTQLGRIMALL
jgi:putative chitinase